MVVKTRYSRKYRPTRQRNKLKTRIRSHTSSRPRRKIRTRLLRRTRPKNITIQRRLRRPPKRSPHLTRQRRPHRRLPHRRLPHRRPWWWYLHPPWTVRIWEERGSPPPSPRWVTMPELRRYTRNARRVLWRVRLLRGVWLDRLAEADEELVRFVNRFYRVPGFHHVVRDYFGGRLRRASARMAMRLAHRLAERHRDFMTIMRFELTSIPIADGMNAASTALVLRERRYLLLPWRRLTARLIRRQLRYSAALYGEPAEMRWVFDRSRLGLDKPAIIDDVRRLARRSNGRLSKDTAGRTWLNALDQVVATI